MSNKGKRAFTGKDKENEADEKKIVKKKPVIEAADKNVDKDGQGKDSKSSSLLASSEMESGSFKQTNTKDKGDDREPVKKKPKTTVSNSNSKVVDGGSDVDMGNKKKKELQQQEEVPVSSKTRDFSKPSSSIVSNAQKKKVMEESGDKDVVMVDLEKKKRKLRPSTDSSPQKTARKSLSKSMKPPTGVSGEGKLISASSMAVTKDSSSSVVVSVAKSKKKETPKKKKDAKDDIEFEKSSQDSKGTGDPCMNDEFIVGKATENMEESVANANGTSDTASQEWQKKNSNAKYILEISCIANEDLRMTLLSIIMHLPHTFSLSVIPPRTTTDQGSQTYHGEFFTHLIVENVHYKRTLKILFAIAYGAKIVSSNWLFAMLEKEGKWVDETPYLLQDGSKFEDAIRKSQMAHLNVVTGNDVHARNKGLLFSKLKFCLVGFTIADSVDERVLGRLIEACGGTLVTETRDSDYTIVGSSAPMNCVDDEIHKTVSVKWVFETVGGYQLLPELDTNFRVMKEDLEEQQNQKSGKKKIEGNKKQQQQQQKHKDGLPSPSTCANNNSNNNNNNNNNGIMTKKKGKGHKNSEQHPSSVASLSAHSDSGLVGEITKSSQDKNANGVEQMNNLQQKKHGEGIDAINKKSTSSSTYNNGKSNAGKGSVGLSSSSPKKSSSISIKAKNKEPNADVVVNIDGNESFENKVCNNEEEDHEGQLLDGTGKLEEGSLSAAAVDQPLLSDDDYYDDNDMHHIGK